MNSTAIPVDNIRSLLSNLSVEIDRRLSGFRSGTRYESVRPSDVRAFVAATRGGRTISDIACALNVSRQAAHASIQRLIKLKVLALLPMPGNQRDRLIAVTARGEHARDTAIVQNRQIESELAQAIGRNDLETLRGALARLVAATAARNAAEKVPILDDEEMEHPVVNAT